MMGTIQKKSTNAKKGKAKENAPVSCAKASPTEEQNGKEIPWEWASITSPAASKVPPIFTRDGNYFFSLVGSSVQIYSAASGEIVSTLKAPTPQTSTDSQSNNFSCAIVNPHNPFQLITGSLAGFLMVWDFLDGALLRTIDIAQPIHLICAHERFKDYVFVAVSRPSKSVKPGNNAVVMRVSLRNVEASTKSTFLKSAEILAVGKTRFTTGLAISSNGDWLVATAGHKVYVAKTSSLTAGFTKYVSPERLTCLAFHPSQDYFATGDDKGVIRMWYCLNDGLAVNVKGVEKKTQTSSMHWHAHAVSALTFTSNGAYLLSGGEEAVLVIWQLHTGRKEFVPRVGSAISTVSVARSKTGEEEYLLGLTDATYTFVNSGSLRISRSYSRVKIDPSAYGSDHSLSVATPLAVHTPSSTILLPSSHPSSLQIYSPSTSTLISELEVSPSNRVSRREDKVAEQSRVEHCVVSSSGRWMATVDAREGDSDFRAETYLKLWAWNEKNAVWILNTRIDKPHGKNKIISLAFGVGETEDLPLQLATIGEDGVVRVWRLRNRKLKGGETEEFWVTRTTLQYHSERPRFVFWSHDGSLLAVSFESCVVVYETSVYTMLQVLTSPECTNPQSAYFIGGGNLLVHGGNKMVLWNILSHSIVWNHSTEREIHSICPHPSESSFAVFEKRVSNESQSTRISLFSLSFPRPTMVYTLPFTLRNMAWYTEGARSDEFSFLGISQNWSLVAFGDTVDLAQEDTSAKELNADTLIRKPTLLQDIFGSSAFVDLSNPSRPDRNQYHVQLSSKSAEAILNSPAYLTPALNTFYDSLISTFLKERVIEDLAPSDTVKMDVDDEDEVGEKEEERPQVVAKPMSSRTITSSEMNDLVGLFRKHGIQDRVPSSTNTKTNGKTTNGRNPPSTPFPPPSNGISPLKSKSSITIASDTSSDSHPSPSLVNGRKRSKAPKDGML